MLIFKLAYRNLIGAGLRTWLNVLVLSIAIVSVIWLQGLVEGMKYWAMDEMVATELGGGQFWHRDYDSFDPLTIEFAHAPVSADLKELIVKKNAIPVLMTSGAVFSEGRIHTILIKGIPVRQKIVNLPSHVLDKNSAEDTSIIPALIGTRMAKQLDLKKDDIVTVRWRDINGTFDAADIMIVHIMNTNAPNIDTGQIWVPLVKMREMMQAPEEATIIILKQKIEKIPMSSDIWIHRDMEFLLKELMDIIKSKSFGNSILYILLLGMACLAVFDTQVLAIFKRRKEMGTLMALGMSRGKVIGLFTVEGVMHAVLAFIVGAIYGIPLLYYAAVKGFTMPEGFDTMGITLPSTLYPTYGAGLITLTTLVLFITVTIVSFLPTRQISKLKPTDALRGKTS